MHTTSVKCYSNACDVVDCSTDNFVALNDTCSLDVISDGCIDVFSESCLVEQLDVDSSEKERERTVNKQSAVKCSNTNPLNPLALAFVPSLLTPPEHVQHPFQNIQGNPSGYGLLRLHKLVRDSGVPNYLGCKFNVPTGFRIPVWEKKLSSYPDLELCALLSYGFPVGFTGTNMPGPSVGNHAGARQFEDAVESYILKEVSLGATVGPFSNNPLSCPLKTSPLNTVPKGEVGRRIIVDLSNPEGNSVNSGIDKSIYLEQEVDLHYPTVDTLVGYILEKGKGSLMYKSDLSRAYRQIYVDPGDIHLLGFQWKDKYYIDTVLPFGLRSASQICQRVTDAIAYMYKNESKGRFKIINYLDDFAGVASPAEADLAFSSLSALFEELGVKEAKEKSCAPSTSMVFIGVKFDTVDMSLEVTPERLEQLQDEVCKWLGWKRARKKDLQSLIGKLQFAAKCVRSGRVFISRMLELLRNTKDGEYFCISSEFKKDLLWWQKFASQFNGVIMMGDVRWSQPDEVIATDASLSGLGGMATMGRYYHCSIPTFLSQVHISVLETAAVVIAIKMWGHELAGKRLLIQCDNSSTVALLNSGKSKDTLMLAWLRELLFHASQFQIQINAVHIEGVINRIPDMLSRWNSLSNRLAFDEYISGRNYSNTVIPVEAFEFQHSW